MKHLLHKFIDKGIDWIFRPRTLAGPLLTTGGALVVAALGADYLVGVTYKTAKETFDFKFATGQGIPAWASLSAFCLGISLIVGGAAILIYRFILDLKRERREVQLIFELRGLHASPDTTSENINLGTRHGNRHWLQIDFRPKNEKSLVDPELILEKLSSIKPTMQAITAGRDKKDIFIALGGLAAVPALFLVGVLFDDESQTIIFDWDRSIRDWRTVVGPDDGDRFLPLAIDPALSTASEVVLAVSVSYAVDELAIAKTFPPTMPVIRLTIKQPLADRFWSEEKQRALSSSFRDAIQHLMAFGVSKIHLVLAAPASLSIRMGMAYDKRLMPNLFVYQYERSQGPAYPWAFQMPMQGTLPMVIRGITS
uniref:SAVED domain-containing protein n=1 Tax=unclassified Variovorax TaxID=663243 RepID=UPI000D3C2B75